MAIHMVLLTEPNADVTARIKEQYVDGLARPRRRNKSPKGEIARVFF